MPTQTRYTIRAEGETAEEMRASLMERYVMKVAKVIFDAAPDFNSVYFSVAQYYSDNADDEVHVEFDIHKLLYPDIRHGLETWTLYDFEEYSGLRVGALLEPLVRSSQGTTVTTGYSLYDNVDVDVDLVDMIHAFASCCREEGSDENFTPYALLRRGTDGQVDVEIIGEVHRPEWENFDVHPMMESHSAADVAFWRSKLWAQPRKDS